MENTFFYTFSTIAQTLAGAIALLAGFVLYRLQLLNADISSLGERLASWIDGMIQRKPEELPGKTLFLEGKYNQLLELANKTPISQGYYQAKTERERLGALLCHKASFILNFYVSLYITTGLIMIAILALIKTPYLSTSCWAPWTLTGAAFWFAGCLFSYLWLLRNAFEEKSLKEGGIGIEPTKERR